MRTKIVVPLIVTGALTLPALALAELGPHESYYDSNPKALGKANEVSVTLLRTKQTVAFYVTNACLGSQTYSGNKYLNGAQIPVLTASGPSIPVTNGRVSWHGKGGQYDSKGHLMKFSASVTATVNSTVAKGKIVLGGKCGTIRFTAKRTGYNK